VYPVTLGHADGLPCHDLTEDPELNRGPLSVTEGNPKCFS
jgi:hypothetical protein